MNPLAPAMLAASAAIILLLGSVHLPYTFRGPELRPRDTDLQARMMEVQPVLTRETTMWKCWVGFNASHSMGAILFGIVYAWLALAQGPFLFQSSFLLWVGLAFFGSYIVLGRLSWFSAPFRGIVAPTVLYVSALVVAWT